MFSVFATSQNSSSGLVGIENTVIGKGGVVQRLDNAIHRINRYLVDKGQQNKPHYPLDSDLYGG